ncbi:MAG: hypothetical protein P4L99_01875, partial [Chthoniobacter sp.]|nr:hypothetical protein [Chthoniobacter sp.]
LVEGDLLPRESGHGSLGLVRRRGVRAAESTASATATTATTAVTSEATATTATTTAAARVTSEALALAHRSIVNADHATSDLLAGALDGGIDSAFFDKFHVPSPSRLNYCNAD